MRSLFPTPGAGEASPGALTAFLDRAYWVEDPGGQFVRAVMISSADGAAALDGKSGGLGNDADTALFALLRAHADVLLVGAATVSAEGYGGDRPTAALRAVRRARGLAGAPRIAVVTRRLSLPVDHPVFTDTEVRPLLVTCASVDREALDRLAEVADVVVAGDDTVDLPSALDQLRERGLRRVSCEGGPTLLAAVAAAGRLDELALTVAPTLQGGTAARILAGPALRPAFPLAVTQVLQDGDFLFLRYGRVA